MAPVAVITRSSMQQCSSLPTPPAAAASTHRPAQTSSWSTEANISTTRLRVDSSLFLPDEPKWTAERMREAIQASQHPEDCDRARYLLVEDNLVNQGLGFTARQWVSALYLALRTNRVLVEVPVDADYPPAPIFKGKKPAITPRWCSVSPHTLQCHYKPWTHCPVPPRSQHKLPSFKPSSGKRLLLRKIKDTNFSSNDGCMTNHSLYVVEDLHTAMMPSYQETGPADFDVLSAEAFHSMMAYWYPGGLRPHPIFAGRVAGVHLYDSIAFLERGPPQKPLTLLHRGKRTTSFADISDPARMKQVAGYREAALDLNRALKYRAAPLPVPPRRAAAGAGQTRIRASSTGTFSSVGARETPPVS